MHRWFFCSSLRLCAAYYIHIFLFPNSWCRIWWMISWLVCSSTFIWFRAIARPPVQNILQLFQISSRRHLTSRSSSGSSYPSVNLTNHWETCLGDIFNFCNQLQAFVISVSVCSWIWYKTGVCFLLRDDKEHNWGMGMLRMNWLSWDGLFTSEPIGTGLLACLLTYLLTYCLLT